MEFGLVKLIFGEVNRHFITENFEIWQKWIETEIRNWILWKFDNWNPSWLF